MAGVGEKDAKGPGEERTTERRLLAASTVMHAAESSRDVTGEDFLFHLYRGSELLQDNRVHEAKEELEHALTLQPRDPKGQDLLAVVYFRIGVYPRAIQIYEQLKRDNPRDPSLKLNLALCYLKTGQAQAARAELEEVVRLQPTHKRAWGYLGLAYERLGDVDKATGAFERGGHTHMIRRLQEKAAPPPRAPGRTMPVGGHVVDADVRGVAQAAFEELDAGELSFSLAEPITGSHAETSPWKTHEPGAPAAPGPRAVPPPAVVAAVPRAVSAGWTVPPTAEAVASVRQEEIVASRRDEPPSSAAPVVAPRATPHAPRAPLPLADLARATRVTFPAAPGVALHPSGVALVRTAAGDDATARPFAARGESIRVHGGALTGEVLSRQTRGKGTGEPFGGLSSPLLALRGAGEIVLAPRPSHRIVAFTLDGGEVFAVREDVLLGFELGPVSYDNGKLALGDGDTAHVVQLRGAGAILLELFAELRCFEIAEGRPLLVRRDALLGWSGRVSPRAVPPVEAPGGQRGLLALSGEGIALISAS